MTDVSVAEALAVLLQTWNKNYYRFHKFDDAHLDKIKALLDRRSATLENYRQRSIASAEPDEDEALRSMFGDFGGCSGARGGREVFAPSCPILLPVIGSSYRKGLLSQARPEMPPRSTLNLFGYRRNSAGC